jgi:hypothetical protein
MKHNGGSEADQHIHRFGIRLNPWLWLFCQEAEGRLPTTRVELKRFWIVFYRLEGLPTPKKRAKNASPTAMQITNHNYLFIARGKGTFHHYIERIL